MGQSPCSGRRSGRAQKRSKPKARLHRLGLDVTRTSAALRQREKKCLLTSPSIGHLAAETGFHEQVLVQGSIQDERSRDLPITNHLARPTTLLAAECHPDVEQVVGALWPECYRPPFAGFAHFRLAPQVVKLQDQLGIGSSNGLL